jgi:hypothetical protein
MKYLKKLNHRLGELCDQNSGKILMSELTESDQADLPSELKVQIMHFLKNYRLD